MSGAEYTRNAQTPSPAPGQGAAPGQPARPGNPPAAREPVRVTPGARLDQAVAAAAAHPRGDVSRDLGPGARLTGGEVRPDATGTPAARDPAP